MSTLPAARSATPRIHATPPAWTAFRAIDTVVKPLGSLKIAVVSFALAIVLILIGTLAQVNRDIWEVLEVYFKVWFAWVDVPIFFPRSWFPQLAPVTAVRMFVIAVIGSSLLAAGLTWFNESRVRPARVLSVLFLVGGIALSLSALLTQGFWFPGGALIGAVMGVNLLAAHLTRYQLQAKGARRWAGLAVTGVGLLITWLVIASGHNADGFQGEPPFAWTSLWQWVKAGLSCTAIGLALFAILGRTRSRFLRPLSGGIGALLGAISVWLWATGEATYLGDSGMRVLWQLILATLAGSVLLAGSVTLFRQRAGVVVLHAGVGLMMFGQWFVGQYDVEEQMTIREGQTLNYGQDIRSVELAVIRRNASEFPGQDDVRVIPLTTNGHPTRFLKEGRVRDELLPFEIRILDYEKSSSVEMNAGGEASPADQGRNKSFKLVQAKPAAGAMGSSVDVASGYFQVQDPNSGEPSGTFLLSQETLMTGRGQIRSFDTETVKVAGVEYDLQLRFVRNYKDYSLQLIDVRKDDYLGTNIPRNYSSDVRLQDEKRGIDQELKIWMNNPRRYAGETFYQSGWQQDPTGTEYTTLQVVRNRGWMIPYVACMIAAIGMLYHFSLVLLRFLDRQTRIVSDGGPAESGASISRAPRPLWRRAIIPLTVAACLALLFARLGTPPAASSGQASPPEMDLYQFGELPLVYQGRVKPFDTLARNTLRVISDAETFKGILPARQLAEAWPKVEQELKAKYPAIESEDLSKFKTGDTNGLIHLIEEKTGADTYAVTQEVESRLFQRQPAVRWLLDVITGSEQARRHKVIRIYHPQILDVLDLQRRKYYRYSLEEIMAKIDAFQEQVQQADRVRRDDVEQLSLYQKKVLEVDRKIRTILLLHRAFSPPDLPALPTPGEIQNDRTAAMGKLDAFRQAIQQQQAALAALQPPLAVAPTEEGAPWEAYAAAWPMQVLTVQMLGREPQPSFKSLNEIMLAYLDEKPAEFNAKVAQYHRQLRNDPPKELQAKPSAINSLIESRFGAFYRFESYFNHIAPFFICSFLYIAAFAILCFGWLKYRVTMNRIAFWLIAGTFLIHTLALIARIYISGRPPVTNLYSSAVFIGWGVVLLALLIEVFFRTGLASLAAAAAGFVTLLIAHKLAGDGDTFEVLQAVLDTQFWLATHVVCITFGYATTFLAGGLGMLYVIRGLVTPTLTKQTSNELARMIYGTLCFAIFFSFVGTVLGGLWADDSWGRFWGWDPKENGALIIVLWNALILHARWDRMIRDRGLAVLSVAGNIVTAWSWFGVNELGVGLHSYGFTEGRLRTLAIAVAAHLIVVAAGWLPLSIWWSYRRQAALNESVV